ncbi:MAG: YgcG family protein [Spirochaetes bacterium]|nr:YgcG family protein [Spirochaetota bacterium]
MKKIFYAIFAIFFSMLPLSASSATGADVPYLTGRVTDNAQILSAETRKTLSESLKAHETRTTNQIAVLTIPTLNGQSIEDYAVKVFEVWKLGQKGKDNGILIIVVPNERRMRIEVGYGLEGTMTDLMAGRIIQNIMTPRFKDGDYNNGIIEGARAVIDVLEGVTIQEAAGAGDRDKSSEKSGFLDGLESDLSITERILFGAFIFGIIGLFTIIGIVTPGVGWFLYLFLIPFWAMFPVIVVGARGALTCLITYLIAFPVLKLILKNLNWYKKVNKDLRTKGKASIGGFVVNSGGSGGSWSSGGSSSSGGFSGGGGSSGGGGASGSW